MDRDSKEEFGLRQYTTSLVLFIEATRERVKACRSCIQVNNSTGQLNATVVQPQGPPVTYRMLQQVVHPGQWPTQIYQQHDVVQPPGPQQVAYLTSPQVMQPLAPHQEVVPFPAPQQQVVQPLHLPIKANTNLHHEEIVSHEEMVHHSAQTEVAQQIIPENLHFEAKVLDAIRIFVMCYYPS